MKSKRNLMAAALACAAVMMAGSVAAALPTQITGWHGLSRATFVWENRSGEAEKQIETEILQNALRQYFGLDEGEALTADLLEQVRTIRIGLSKFNGLLDGELAGKTAVKCVINGGFLPGAAHTQTQTDEDFYDGFGYDLFPEVIRAQYFDLSPITDKQQQNKVRSFYTLKDSADPTLTERAVAEMNVLFPNTAVAALAILDPYAKPRELAEIARIAVEYGIANLDTLYDGTVIDLSADDLAQFPNLEYVEYADDLTPAEDHPPVKLVKAPALEEPEVPEKEGVVLESSLLNSAIRGYFGLTEDEILTEDMAAQVETIDFVTSIWQEGLALVEGHENQIAVKCVINGGAVRGEDGESCASISDGPLTTLFQGKKSVLGYEALPVMVWKNSLRLDEITDEWQRNKMQSFYTIKGTAGLEPEEAEELVSLYPCTAAGEFAVFDPMARPRELRELLSVAFQFGIVNEDTLLDTPVLSIPSEDFAKLPGLVLVTCDDDFVLE
ncbi:MAG: hypothetical protein ACI4V1_05920 [Eubacteriales bacterium]